MNDPVPSPQTYQAKLEHQLAAHNLNLSSELFMRYAQGAKSPTYLAAIKEKGIIIHWFPKFPEYLPGCATRLINMLREEEQFGFLSLAISTLLSLNNDSLSCLISPELLNYCAAGLVIQSNTRQKISTLKKEIEEPDYRYAASNLRLLDVLLRAVFMYRPDLIPAVRKGIVIGLNYLQKKEWHVHLKIVLEQIIILHKPEISECATPDLVSYNLEGLSKSGEHNQAALFIIDTILKKGGQALQTCINQNLIRTVMTSQIDVPIFAELCTTILKSGRQDLYPVLVPEVLMASVTELMLDKAWWPLLALGEAILSSGRSDLLCCIPKKMFSEAAKDLLQYAIAGDIEAQFPPVDITSSPEHRADIQEALNLIATAKANQSNRQHSPGP